jgi:alkylation response protein AidB-like acyl-CoA dehydrogenase
VDLHLNDEQRLIQREARELLARHCAPADVQQWLRAGVARPPELWRRIADLGWLGFALPQAHGGLGADFLDLVLLHEVCGWALVPTLFGTTTAAGLAIAACGTDAQRERWLPGIARGETAATLAIAEPEVFYDLGRITTTLAAGGEGYTLSGRKAAVECGIEADLLVVVARPPVPDQRRHVAEGEAGGKGAGAGRNAVTLAVVPRSAPGVRATPVATFGGEPAADVTFERVSLGRDAVLTGDDAGAGRFGDVLQRITVLLCAEMVGGLERVLELTTDYVREREQFGRPIGSFQAVQHALADVATALEGARYATYQAAWRLARGLPAIREVAIAKAWTSPAYTQATLTAHQLHGGMGFVTEYPLWLYSNRAKWCEARLGTADRHLETVAAALEI